MTHIQKDSNNLQNFFLHVVTNQNHSKTTFIYFRLGIFVQEGPMGQLSGFSSTSGTCYWWYQNRMTSCTPPSKNHGVVQVEMYVWWGPILLTTTGRTRSVDYGINTLSYIANRLRNWSASRIWGQTEPDTGLTSAEETIVTWLYICFRYGQFNPRTSVMCQGGLPLHKGMAHCPSQTVYQWND